ncbi:hypothetical protein DEO72_LG9g2033 [Vigna unguiculata]|uniref:Uncharacterized protein n=1 Tax=Vigna unguiculata TaxID=3917 RepID=A0A4D6N174_VIGUN|nr:hypothetical protein DEO72_LG9g2033 [Vigna unguiculata]
MVVLPSGVCSVCGSEALRAWRYVSSANDLDACRSWCLVSYTGRCCCNKSVFLASMCVVYRLLEYLKGRLVGVS